MVTLTIPSPNHGQLSGERLDALVTGAAAVPLTLKALSTDITSGGTGANEDFTIPNGSYVGERKLSNSRSEPTPPMLCARKPALRVSVSSRPEA